MANRKVKALKSDNKQGKVREEGAKPNKAASRKSKAKTTPKRYKTQGVIANIDLTARSFSIDPIPPYVFEQKKGVAEKSMLFVSTPGDNKENEGAIIDAKIMTGDCMFSTPKGVDLNALITLKNGGVKIEIEVELARVENEMKLASKSLKTVKA